MKHEGSLSEVSNLLDSKKNCVFGAIETLLRSRIMGDQDFSLIYAEGLALSFITYCFWKLHMMVIVSYNIQKVDGVSTQRSRLSLKQPFKFSKSLLAMERPGTSWRIVLTSCHITKWLERSSKWFSIMLHL